MFAFFERLVDPFRPAPISQPPEGLFAFYWHYTRQIWPLLVAVLVAGFAVAWVEVSLFRFVGELVDLLGKANPDTFVAEHGATFAWMAFVVVVARPVVNGIHDLLVRQAITPGFANLVRWQAHRWVIRQSVTFFQNDFAGRIANRILQVGPALRESVVEVVDALWYVAVYAGAALILFADADPRLAAPLAVWIVAYAATLAFFVPRVQKLSKEASETRSLLTGRIVDGYTNVPTVKLFAHAAREDAHVREAIAWNTEAFRAQQRRITAMNLTVSFLNSLLMASTGAVVVWLWLEGAVTLGAIALATGLVIRIANMAGWIMWVVTGVFENFGTVQEGMATIAKPHTVVDQADAAPIAVPLGEVRFENVRFHYGRDRGVIDDLTLTVKPGERVGLIGPSGAGKSTLVNLLLRFHDLEGGRILVDGQDVAAVTQESLRAAIGVVTQDTSLLHRSVRDNIRYGRPEASEEQIHAAAERAHADEFIANLVDPNGRRGYDAHVGERGVKLSGGQRQRVAIARVLLKDAPILLLDEATSALDSEIEAAIQASLEELMGGKTVIAIAHRLSTIARMDRLVVLDRGRIVETGRHNELLRAGGLYARLWRRQSGGFLDMEEAAAAAE